MACKSMQALRSLQSPASRRDLGRQSCPANINRCPEPVSLPVEDARPDRRAGNKRKVDSDKSQRAATKRMRRKSQRAPSSSSNTATACSINTGRTLSTAEFKTKYAERIPLGQGGYGSVYCGYRREDRFPVAIKHIPRENVIYTSRILDGEPGPVPLEVMLLLKAASGPVGSSAAVALLDWFYMDQELILIMERPVHSLDLDNYIELQGGFLPEDQAKVLMRQLLEAASEIHSRGVFHRDLKLENVLVEAASDPPRVRIIDFGCGCVLQEGSYSGGYGTSEYTPPEWYRHDCYSAGPTTVWQLGVMLFGMLFGDLPFNTEREILYSSPRISKDVTRDCEDFLCRCLAKLPQGRPTLEQLKFHPWLK